MAVITHTADICQGVTDVRPEASVPAVRNTTHGAWFCLSGQWAGARPNPGPKWRLNLPNACCAAGPKPAARELRDSPTCADAYGDGTGWEAPGARGGAGLASSRVGNNLPSVETYLRDARFLKRQIACVQRLTVWVSIPYPLRSLQHTEYQWSFSLHPG